MVEVAADHVAVPRTSSRAGSARRASSAPVRSPSALDRIRIGDRATDADLGRIEERLRIVTDGNRCYLPVQEQHLVSSILRAFPEDVAAHLEGCCPSERRHDPVPKIIDLADGVVTYDERQERKRPDWTYAD